MAAVAVQAARGLLGPSLDHVRGSSALTARWAVYLAVGGAAAALLGAYLVLALLACGLVEMLTQRRLNHVGSVGLLLPGAISAGGIGALAWTAFKVGALSFGGGFVIIPLMQGDAVHTYHWMTNPEFLSAVALGQITPGPVVATVAAVGYAAHGLAGGLLAALVAFTPSFCSSSWGAAGSSSCATTNAPARSWMAPTRPRSARSWAPRFCSPESSKKPGSSRPLRRR